MQWSMLWYVLAGFILGFAISTLWEWLYFRQRRMQMTDLYVFELERELRELRDMRQPVGRAGSVVTVSDVLSAPSPSASAPSPSNSSPKTSASVSDKHVNAESDELAHVMEPTEIPVQSNSIEASPMDRNAGYHSDAALLLNEQGQYSLSDTMVQPGKVHIDEGNSTDDFDFKPDAVRQTPHSDGQKLQQEDKSVQTATETEEITGDSHSSILQSSHKLADAPLIQIEDDLAKQGEILTIQQLNQLPDDEDEPTAKQAKRILRPAIPRRSTGYPDDLAKIRGIGEVYKRRLYEAGIFTWHQLIESGEEMLRTATRSPATTDTSAWIEQAQELAEQYNREGATYVGPVPDDLTQIPGIRASEAQELCKAGIGTYEQLAASRPDELAQIFAVSVFNRELDFERWIQQSIKFATVKQTLTH